VEWECVIRVPAEEGWHLVTHPDHARLASEFARHWKNDSFEPPKPFAHVLDAVARHDDSWSERDMNPELTRDGLPSAFSRQLVGTYSAFEEIDMEPYLRVRERNTEAAAERDPYAAVLISMHTVNLLTEQADLSTLDDDQRAIHGEFVEGQRTRQAELRERLRSRPDVAPYADEEHFQRAFEFLQACDNLSLLVCADYDDVEPLRHEHPRRDGDSVRIRFEPLGDRRYSCDPWPFDEPELRLGLPYRHVPTRKFDSRESFREQFHAAEVREHELELVAP
jgi:hypothetical protein